MNTEEATNPVAEEPVEAAAVEGVADEANAQGDDQQLDEDGNPVDPDDAEDDSEEIEHEGAKYKLPKPLAKEFREGTLRQADYTRKTQEIAQTRSALEARQTEIVQQAEAQAETLAERVQLATLETQLAQFNDFDWADYERQYGAGAVATAMAQWRTLENAHGQLKGSISEKEQEHRLSSERVTASALQEAATILRSEYKEAYGNDLFARVAEAANSFGITDSEMKDAFVGRDGSADIRMFKMLAEIGDLRAFKAKTETRNTKAQTAEKVAAVKPATTVKPTGGQFKAGLDDSLPNEEWQRRRNAEVAKANRH